MEKIKIENKQDDKDVTVDDLLKLINEDVNYKAGDINKILNNCELNANYQYVFEKDGMIQEAIIDPVKSPNYSINQFVVYSWKKFNFKKTCERLLNGAVFQKLDEIWTQVCFPLPNPEPYDFNREIKEDGIDEAVKKFTKKYSEKGPFIVQELFDGTIMNAYFSKLHDYWMIGTKRHNDILVETYRGIEWKQAYNQYPHILNMFVENTDYTYILNISDVRIHYMTSVSDLRILARSKKDFIEYSDKLAVKPTNVSSHFKTMFSVLNKSDTRNFTEETRRIVGYVLRFKDRNDVIIKSRVFDHISKLVYRYYPDQCEKKDFYSLSYPIANSFCRSYGNSVKYFPNFVKYYDIILDCERKIAETIVGCHFGKKNEIQNKYDELSKEFEYTDDSFENKMKRVECYCIFTGMGILNGSIKLGGTECLFLSVYKVEKAALDYVLKFLSRNRGYDRILTLVNLVNPVIENKDFDTKEVQN